MYHLCIIYPLISLDNYSYIRRLYLYINSIIQPHFDSLISDITMETPTSFAENSIDIFKVPSRIIIAGYSNSGKSEFCKKLIEKYHTNFQHILYCGTDSHPLQNDEKINDKLTVSPTILNPFDYSHVGNLLFILDDCFLEAVEDKNVVDAFTKGRHKSISTIFITQNLFFSGKHSRNISLNCSHYVLMRNRDMGQIELLGRQLYGKGLGGEFLQIYKKALSVNKYGYLLIDLGPNTPEELQLRTNVLGETPYQIIYQW